MPFVLAILALLAGALTWMFASAGLARYRLHPGSGWTELLPAIVVGFVAVLLATLAIVAARVRRQQAELATRIAQSPERPWLHVPQWNRGRLQDAPAKQAQRHRRQRYRVGHDAEQVQPDAANDEEDGQVPEDDDKSMGGGPGMFRR